MSNLQKIAKGCKIRHFPLAYPQNKNRQLWKAALGLGNCILTASMEMHLIRQYAQNDPHQN